MRTTFSSFARSPSAHLSMLTSFGAEQPGAGAVKRKRVAFEQGRVFLKQRLNAIGMIEIEGEVAEMLVASLGFDADRAQDNLVELRRKVGVQRAWRLWRVEDRHLET